MKNHRRSRKSGGYCRCSGCTLGQENGDAVDDGIAARAAIAAHEFGLQRQRLAANRADKPLKMLLLEGLRSGFRGWLERHHPMVRGRRGGGTAGPGQRISLCAVPWEPR